jgi:AAA family ATP:ADP antiporter
VTTSPKEFGKYRAFLWPIKGYETKKFLPMCLIMFFTIFNYTVLRNTKDALMITQSGAEVIPFLKGGIVMPFSILFVFLYAKLANLLSRENLFYVTISFFLGFFILFALVLYPYREVIQPSAEKIHALKQAYPYFQHIFPLFGVWIYSAFYVFAELWGAVILNLSFWQFANETTRIQEAKRFYAMFGLIGHAALIFGGYTVRFNCEVSQSSTNSCADYINYTVLVVTLCGIIIMSIYRWINRVVLVDPLYYDGADTLAAKETGKRLKLSLFESLKYILTSKYIGLIAILVFSYSFCMNLLGLIWKKQLNMQFPNPLDYGHFMGNFSIINGFITITIIFFFKGIVSKFGWFRGAIMTPMILLVTAILIFAFLFFQDILSPLVLLFGTTPLMVGVMISTAQQILSKSSKYSLFDPTKEMAYIPLDSELKVKGKAAVDVTVHQFGKAAGGYVSGALLVVLMASDLLIIAPYLAGIVLLCITIWVLAVKALNREYNVLVFKQSHTPSLQPGLTSVG